MSGLLTAEDRFELLQELLDIGGVRRRGRRRRDRMEVGELGQRARPAARPDAPARTRRLPTARSRPRGLVITSIRSLAALGCGASLMSPSSDWTTTEPSREHVIVDRLALDPRRHDVEGRDHRRQRALAARHHAHGIRIAAHEQYVLLGEPLERAPIEPAGRQHGHQERQACCRKPPDRPAPACPSISDRGNPSGSCGSCALSLNTLVL